MTDQQAAEAERLAREIVVQFFMVQEQKWAIGVMLPLLARFLQERDQEQGRYFRGALADSERDLAAARAEATRYASERDKLEEEIDGLTRRSGWKHKVEAAEAERDAARKALAEARGLLAKASHSPIYWREVRDWLAANPAPEVADRHEFVEALLSRGCARGFNFSKVGLPTHYCRKPKHDPIHEHPAIEVAKP